MGRVNSISDGGTLPPGGDPDAYAKAYAEEHGITVDEAKAELRSKYGDPQQPTQSPMFMNEAAQKIYSNISPDELGKPLFNFNPFARMDGSDSTDLTSEADYAEVNQDDPKTATLKRAGIPEDVIKQGDDAVRKYAREHGIELPPPPQRPPQGPAHYNVT